jgi:hypothetical protein
MKTILMLLGFILMLSSCKKEELEENTPSTNNNQPTTITGYFQTLNVAENFNQQVYIYVDDILIGNPPVYNGFDACSNQDFIPFDVQVGTQYNLKLKDSQGGNILHEIDFVPVEIIPNEYDFNIINFSSPGDVDFNFQPSNCSGTTRYFFLALV